MVGLRCGRQALNAAHTGKRRRGMITYVKKILEDGSECPKCMQATELLEKRGLLDRIDRTVLADVRDAESEGAKLAATWGVKRAPFFIVEELGRSVTYVSVLDFIKKELSK